MQYMLLIYTDDARQPKPGDDNFGDYMQGYGTCTEDFRAREVMVAGDALQGTETATTVRVAGGETTVTDGPFAETKETLGGYYLLDCKDLDDAIASAAQIPGAQYGSIENRPVVVFD